MTEQDGMRQREAAAYLGISEAALRKLVRLGQVPHRRAPGLALVLFSRRALSAWLAGQDAPAEAPEPPGPAPAGAQTGAQTAHPTGSTRRRPYEPVGGKILDWNAAR